MTHKHPSSRAPRPTLTFDYTRYAPMLDDPSLSEDQKRQMLEALWSLVVQFVDLGFAVEPTEESCGQVGSRAADLGFAPKEPLDCKDAFAAQITLPTQKEVHS